MVEQFTLELAESCLAKLYYGHFFCHFFHQDYIIHKGRDTAAFKNDILLILDCRHAEYPADYNVGHIYKAKPELAAFYIKTNLCNVFNPGIGKARAFLDRDNQTMVAPLVAPL